MVQYIYDIIYRRWKSRILNVPEGYGVVEVLESGPESSKGNVLQLLNCDCKS